MRNQKLVEYIKKQLSRNKSEDEIIKTLEGIGWDYTDIVKALSTAKRQKKLRKLILRYLLSVIIIAVLFLSLEFISNFYHEMEYNFETSEKISILNSLNISERNQTNFNQTENLSCNNNKDLPCTPE